MRRTGHRTEQRTAREQAGYTLTEVIVAVAIFAIIFIAALTVYDQSNKVFKSGVESSDTQQSTRIAFDKLVADIRMAGFDYDRDGIPTATDPNNPVYQQPDEQLEYIGWSAITIRANFNWGNDPNDPSHGEETSLESGEFPVVTTGNDEIVTYALQSKDSSANTGQIQFYADVPDRRAYPGGRAENLVTISNVDLTNAHPPYTLERITLDASGNPIVTPLADNIRSLTFTYYEDFTGTTQLTAIDGTTTIDPTTMDSAVGGQGQYNPANPGALIPARTIRSKVRSIKIDLVGMNSSEDAAYTDPYETSTAGGIQHYRKYRLDTLVVPRNLGKRGMREQSVRPPGAPTITKLCFGHCGIAYLEWKGPVETGSQGAAEQYVVEWDTVGSGTWSGYQPVGNVTNTYIYGLNPSQTYYFAVKAVNGYGASDSVAPYPSGQPTNSTTPQPPTNLAITNSTAGTAVAGKVTLTWDMPTSDVSPYNTMTCNGTSVETAYWVPAEIVGYRIWRSTVEDFTPSASNLIHDYTSPGVVMNYSTDKAMFDDTTAVGCTTYYYRIQGVEQCRDVGTLNTGGAIGETTIVPPASSDAIEGDALTTGVAPNAPIALSVDFAASSCTALPNQCTVKLNWPAVMSDTSGNRVYVNDYIVNRSRKKDTDTTYTSDPIPVASPQVTNGTSQGSTVSFTDNTAEYWDPINGGLWHYRYTVQAVTCGTSGAESPNADYPGCSFSGSPIVEAGATSGDGLSEATAWVMNAGDSVTVSAPAGVTLTQVTFALYNAAGAQIDTGTINAPGPYVYGWSDRTDGEVYRLVVTIKNDAGCQEQDVRYIQDQSVAPCETGTAPQIVGTFTPGVAASNDIQTYTVNVGNAGSENLTPEYVNVLWTDKSGVTGLDEATLTSINFDGIVPLTGSWAEGTATGLLTVPPGTPVVTPGATYVLTFRFEARKQRDDATPVLNPIDKLCFAYSIASEPGVTKYCNVVGAGSPSNNPNSCD